MNNDNLILLAVVGLVAYFLINKAGGTNTIKNVGKPVGIFGISEIFTGAKDGQVGAGWRYFTDGASISPEGIYYMNGVEVWRP